MRSYLRAMVLALAIGPFTPDVASCQDIDAFEDAPPPRRVVTRRRGWRSSPLIWGSVAAVLAVAIPVGVFKTIRQMRQGRAEQEREKAPWERAMADFERNRAK
jgi:hypothetical protein